VAVVVEQKIRDRIVALVQDGDQIAIDDTHDQARNQARANACIGWIAAANHIIALVCPSPTHPYREASERTTKQWYGFSANRGVGELTSLLKQLLIDIDQGMLTSVADQARAETLDDLLDEAAEYHKLKHLQGSGVLGTAVFEDTLRRICRSNGIADNGVKTDALISALAGRNLITSVVAKRCRAAAGVRNQALHAQWSEVTLKDIEAVISLTRELTTHLA
jgi:hypothetical protein